MSHTFRLIVIVSSVIIFCVDVDNSIQNDLLKNVINVSDIVVKPACLNPLKCHEELLWHRLDIRQWKRRRRTLEFLKETNIIHLEGEIESRMEVSHTNPPVSVQDRLLIKFKETWPVNEWRRYGWFDDNYLLMINRHWVQFAPPDPRVYYALGSFYTVMFSIGSFGNILVLYMYFRFV